MKKGVMVFIAAAFFAGLILCVPLAPAWSADPIVVGIPTALNSDYGRDSVNAVKLAVKEINDKGGVNVGGQKRPIKLIISDTRDMEPTTPAHDALMAVEKMILQDKPHAILVGFARSEVFMAGMELIAKHKIPYLGSYAQTHMFQQQFAKDPEKYKYIFRVCGYNVIAAKAATDAIDVLRKEHGLKRAFFITQDTLLSKGFVGVLKKHCENTGWQTVGTENIASDAADFSAVLSKVKSSKAQITVVFWDVAQGGTIMLKQWTSMKVPSLMVGFVIGACSPRGWDFMGKNINYIIQTEAPIGSGIPLKKLPKTRAFVEKFNKAYGKPHGQWLTSASYESVYILAGAIERAGSLDPAKLVKEIEKTDYAGVIGRIRFDKNHQVVYGDDPKETAVCLAYQWLNGKMVPIYPPAVAEGKVVLPPWMK
ncbi:MAG TPA: ABC transporter substrate-binding protein [Syntrophales bacterium]|nr:ABC transporter substrate-binding protein [Syntrophales bacterium]HOX94483.1 ABC transporter substrate-binding protein [Syntrophales bacterium]HPN25618.1 ABC transporter substrate-binding protein [Syntrophales bacterium]HQM28124.1 ABC transporter substrate-binding protein [Syntrophales bacterium]